MIWCGISIGCGKLPLYIESQAINSELYILGMLKGIF